MKYSFFKRSNLLLAQGCASDLASPTKALVVQSEATTASLIALISALPLASWRSEAEFLEELKKSRSLRLLELRQKLKSECS